MGFPFPSLPDHSPSPLESFLLQSHAGVRQEGVWGAPDYPPGEAGLKPKAADQMWAHPVAVVFCLTCMVLKKQRMFQKSENSH